MSDHPDILPPQLPTFTPLYAVLFVDANTTYYRVGNDVKKSIGGSPLTHECLWRNWEKSRAYWRMTHPEKRYFAARDAYPGAEF